MILYKKEDWWKCIWYFHTGDSARSILKGVLIAGLYVTIIAVVEFRFLDLKLSRTPTEYFSALGILLSLLLVYRTNTAYDRFYEGRKAWGSLINTSRNLAALLSGILPEDDDANRRFFARGISNFAFALTNTLRNNPVPEGIEDLDVVPNQMLPLIEHQPGAVVAQLRLRLEQLYRAGVITDAQSINLNGFVGELLNVAGICERIKNTPIPFSYSYLIKFLIMVYILILPFTLLEEYGYVAVPVVMITSYMLIGLEILGEEIEDPFGVDRNDLPLNQLSNLIRVNVHDLLYLHLPSEEKEAAKPLFTVVI
ncbi:bestrophin family protein [Tellurirhabdus rosea]|uniref:bestrophin family protein n=1 Tax=Tellurirhabdus rosea TaxID=2674997 RepID=UPI00224D10E6|nr:bestrophin family ion channel [Tellurirhabdus rosea]